MANQPDEGDNGERQPDSTRPGGGTDEEREHGRRIESHNRPITTPTDPEATKPGGAEVT